MSLEKVALKTLNFRWERTISYLLVLRYIPNRHLTWISHIKHLKERYSKGLGLLKCLSHWRWGVDRLSLMKILQCHNKKQDGLWLDNLWLWHNIMKLRREYLSAGHTGKLAWITNHLLNPLKSEAFEYYSKSKKTTRRG